MRRMVLPLALCFTLLGSGPPSGTTARPDWMQVLNERLALYGHRNWIVVADSAYPAQAREGVQTIVSNADQMEVLRFLTDRLSTATHVRPIILIDRELKYVPESDAPGITAYRNQVNALFNNRELQSLPHEEIISKLDKTGQTFRVLIIKTNLTLPYTSVFFELDCAYWSAEAEARMRAAMSKQENR